MEKVPFVEKNTVTTNTTNATWVDSVTCLTSLPYESQTCCDEPGGQVNPEWLLTLV